MTKYDSSIDKILDIEIDDILSVKKTLNRNVAKQIIDLLIMVKPNGRKIITSGCGTSGTLAHRVSHTLSVVEIPSFFLSPADAVHGGAGSIQKDDVVILFSKGGNTEEILNFLPICKDKQAIIIGVSQNDDSVLAKHSNIYFKLLAEHEADQWDMCASASCNMIAAVWDALAFTAVQYTRYTKDDLKLIHSGGKVGEMLK